MRDRIETVGGLALMLAAVIAGLLAVLVGGGG